MNNWCICWFFTLFLLGILIFKWLTARRLYKSFGVKGLIHECHNEINHYTENQIGHRTSLDLMVTSVVLQSRTNYSHYGWSNAIRY
jgi:hypothetical protein